MMSLLYTHNPKSRKTSKLKCITRKVKVEDKKHNVKEKCKGEADISKRKKKI